MIIKKLLPHQAALIQAPYRFPEARFFFLIAGYACVHEDTLLDTPQGMVKIKDFKGGYLYAFDEAAKKAVVAKALPAEKLGTEEMYEVNLSNGRSIRATKKHRFLTPQGYKTISEFSSEQQLLTYEHTLLESISDTCQSARYEGDLSSRKIPLDCLDGCLNECHSCGELPRSEAATCPASVPSQVDARIYNHSFGQMDDPAHGPVCNRTCLQSSSHDSSHSSCRKDRRAGKQSQHRIACTGTGCTSDPLQSSLPSPLNTILEHSALSTPKQDPESAVLSCTFSTSVVESIKHIGGFVYYDLHVPYYNNYLAEGMINHNSGKTSALVDATLKAVKYFSGKLDKEGKPPKIGVCGITLTFLKKTFVGSLVASFRQSKSVYNYDKAHNVIYVAGVELHLTPIINEEDIFGFDWACIGQYEPVSTNKGDIPIKDIQVGDQVLTRQGYKKVTAVMKRGVKEVRRMRTNDGKELVLTDDHKVFTCQEGFVESKDLTNDSILVTINQYRRIAWQENQEDSSDVKLLCSTEKRTTDIQTLQSTEEERTSIQQIIEPCTKTCGNTTTDLLQKALTYIIKTATTITMSLKTLCLSHDLNIYHFTTLHGQKKEKLSNQKQCEKPRRYDQKDNEQYQEDKSNLIGSRNPGKTGKEYRVRVLCVEHLSSENYPTHGSAAPTVTTKREGAEGRRPLLHTSKLSEISSESWLEEVYDIEVEDAHEFFAGGILVHNCAVVDELDELATYTAVAVVKSINDRCRQSVVNARPPFLVFATTSQGLKGTYQVVQNFKKKGINYVLIRARTQDNIHLPKEYVEAQYKIYNEKETQCLLEGKFISIDSGLVYPDYDPSVNRLDYSLYETVKPSETVFVGQDFNVGFNKAVAFVAREGVLYAVKEYSFPDIRRAPEVFRYDFRENVIKWIPDATYNQHLPEFKKELRQHKINVIYRSKNPLIKDRAFLMNKLFFTERMYISHECRELDNALIMRQNDKNTGLPMKGKGEIAPDHITDPAEYVAAYCTAWLKEFRDLYKVTLGRRLDKRIEAGLTSEEEEKYSEGVAIEDKVDVQ